MGECNYHYYPAANEEGWRCADCDHRPGEPPGFSPSLDRSEIYLKVGAILMDACDANLVSVSNGSEGDYLTALIADRCVKEQQFDQYSILFYLLDRMTGEHADYWKEIGDGIMVGKDKRDRCHCGQLAYTYIGSAHYCSMKCAPALEGAPF